MTTCETTKQVRVLYPAPVRDSARCLRVFPPVQRGSQRVLNLQWQCTPPPDKVCEFEDEFGNRVLELHHRRIAREFCFEMKLVTMKLVTTRDLSSVPPFALADTNLPPTGLGAFLVPSALCDLSDEVLSTAQQLKEELGIPANGHIPYATHHAFARICEWTHRALQYSSGATHTATKASEALSRRAGVCQDYAHLMIAICRALQIPARYISGYNPTEGAMHAWVEVLCGGASGQWQAWDPTHNRATTSNYVFVACGRDFRDVAPLTGRYRGRGSACLEVFCKTKIATS